MERRQRGLFYRWLWLVYVPMVLGVIGIGVAMAGILPRQGKLPLIALLAWNAGGVWLLSERKRRQITVPVPRSLAIGLALLTATFLLGLMLAWAGVDRLSSSRGPELLVAGTFLLAVAGLAPAFKLLDALARFLGRSLLALTGRGTART